MRPVDLSNEQQNGILRDIRFVEAEPPQSQNPRSQHPQQQRQRQQQHFPQSVGNVFNFENLHVHGAFHGMPSAPGASTSTYSNRGGRLSRGSNRGATRGSVASGYTNRGRSQYSRSQSSRSRGGLRGGVLQGRVERQPYRGSNNVLNYLRGMQEAGPPSTVGVNSSASVRRGPSRQDLFWQQANTERLELLDREAQLRTGLNPADRQDHDMTGMDPVYNTVSVTRVQDPLNVPGAAGCNTVHVPADQGPSNVPSTVGRNTVSAPEDQTPRIVPGAVGASQGFNAPPPNMSNGVPIPPRLTRMANAIEFHTFYHQALTDQDRAEHPRDIWLYIFGKEPIP